DSDSESDSDGGSDGESDSDGDSESDGLLEDSLSLMEESDFSLPDLERLPLMSFAAKRLQEFLVGVELVLRAVGEPQAAATATDARQPHNHIDRPAGPFGESHADACA